MNEFLAKLSSISNSNQSRSIILCGNVSDLFFDGEKYVPLMKFLAKKCQTQSKENRKLIQIHYELNKRINILNQEDFSTVAHSWGTFKGVQDGMADLQNYLDKSFANPTVALELLRQLTACSRTSKYYDLLIIIERADLIMPETEVARMSLSDRRNCVIAHDWFSEPDFYEGTDTVIFTVESRSQLHSLVAKMPQILSVEIPYPDLESRKHFLQLWQNTDENLAKRTAGLSIFALRQLLLGQQITTDEINKKVEEYICSQLGEDVVEFKRPKHCLDDTRGFKQIKNFIKDEMIPRFQAEDDSALTGAGVAGPIGCHAKGQEILLFNGDRKKVEEIVVNDCLMGPDSTPRKVLSLISGKGQMYEIIPIKGKSFVVNEDHILSLKRTISRRKDHKKKDNKAGEIIDVSVKNWLAWSKNRKGLYKLFRTGVQFAKQELPINPYFMGVLLGDGSFVTSSPSITSLDFEVLVEAIQQAKVFNLKPRADIQKKTKAVSIFLTGKKKNKNPIAEILRGFDLWGKKSQDKFIPHIYMISDYQQRLQLLAGLLDTDGSYGHGFDFTSTSERLCIDVENLTRSLGMAAYKSGPFLKKNQFGNECICWRVSISGEIDKIPTKIDRKKAKSRKQKKSVLVTGFSVKKISIDDFYGFQLDGDGRFLLGDFTVTHNSGKTYLMEAMAAELDMPVLTLKNLRSQWFGQTDVIFERLRRTLMALDKVVIFIDEADTQFGGVGSDTHETERRLTGKIQGMMSDSALRGKVIWLLMTARIEKLSADIRRPGRVGDLIIPILDPIGDDKLDFCDWILTALKIENSQENIQKVNKLTDGYSSASFQSLLSLAKAKKCQTVDELIIIAADLITADIGAVRRYQTIQAMLNCTRVSLLPPGTDLEQLRQELLLLRID